MEEYKDSRTPNPFLNLIAWLIAISLGVATVMAVKVGPIMTDLISGLFRRPTPLIGRFFMGIGLAIPALFLILFFVFLIVALVRNAVMRFHRDKHI